MLSSIVSILRKQWLAVAAICLAVGATGVNVAMSRNAHKHKVDTVRKIVARQGTPVTIAAGATEDAFAKCIPGEKLIGGGGAPAGVFGNGGNGGFIQFDGPDFNVPNQWQMKAYSTGGATLRVTAYCAHK